MISTIIAVAIFITKYFFLEAFAIKFEAFGSLTVAAELLFCDHIVLLFVDRRLQKTGVTTLATLRKGWGTVPNGVFDWEAFVDAFFEGFSEGLRVERVLCVNGLVFTLGIFPWTFVFHFGGDEFLIGAGAVEYFSEIFGFEGFLFGLIAMGLHKGFFRWYLILIFLLNEELLKQVVPLNRTLLFNLGRFSYLWKIILLLDVHIYLSNQFCTAKYYVS